VRFFARHSAIVYFFVLVALWVVAPTLAYNFSELIEAHAVDTYDEFCVSNEEILKRIPAPKIAKDYYMGLDMHTFDEFQIERTRGSRRPKIETLYDVFRNISEDEGSHVKVMAACQGDRRLDPKTDAMRSYISDFLVVSLAIGFAILSSDGVLIVDENIVETAANFWAQGMASIASGSISDEEILLPVFMGGLPILGPSLRALIDLVSKLR
jgi:hypothetical protein